jgi:hypothetical protein
LAKTEPDKFEDEDKKPLEDKFEGGGFNACDIEQPEDSDSFLTFTASNALILWPFSPRQFDFEFFFVLKLKLIC